MTRCALEPACLLLLAIVLQDFFVIQSGLAPYLQLAAVALAMKSFISWFPLEAQQRFLGVWDGTQNMVNGNNCRIHLELRLSPYQPGYVAGYETRFCYDLSKFLTYQSQQNGVLAAAADAKSPVATVLTGSLFEGDLTFRVDRTINSSQVVCPVDSYSVAPFGSQQVIALWKSHGCPDGQMVLTRGRG